MLAESYDFIIVGAGIYGLFTAFFLSETGAKILLLERNLVGHNQGSSHGASRIIRCTYQDAFYRDLCLLGLQESWPYVEKKLEVKLVFPTAFIYFFDNPKIYAVYQKLSAQIFGASSCLTSQEICKKFPHFPFIKSSSKTIIDSTAGVLLANQAMLKMYGYLKKCPNVVIRENTEVTQIQEDQQKVIIRVRDQVSEIYGTKALVTVGRWISTLIPESKEITKVIKQYVAFLEIESMENYQLQNFPCFAHDQQGIIFFFLPSINTEGLKIGIHNTSLPNLDQHLFQKLVTKKAIELFGQKFFRIIKIEECFYTVTKTEDFLIDWIDPRKQRILAASCCSGHGFKFAAILGRVIKDVLIQNGSIELYEKNKHQLSIPFHKGVNLQ